MIPNITRGVDWFLIHCDVISWQVADVESNALYSLLTIGRNVSYAFWEEPRRLEFHPVNKFRVDLVRVQVTLLT